MKQNRKLKFVLTFLGLPLSIVLLIAWYMNVFNSDMVERNVDRDKNSPEPFMEVGGEHIPINRHVTTTSSSAGEFFQRVVYNRVGKCGSRSMLVIIKSLCKRNHFHFFSSPISNLTRPHILELKKEVQLVDSIASPMLYSRHIHYINFLKFGLQPPIYINMIRDPIERFSSHYHFRRFGDGRDSRSRWSEDKWETSRRDMDINECVLSNHTECMPQALWYLIPYFCGQEAICKHPGEDALKRAKLTVMDQYLAVGVLEDFEGTLKVFEKLLPHHFDGASEVWAEMQEESNSEANKTATNNKKELSVKARIVLRKRMAMDYDFYNFVLSLFRILKRHLHVV